MKMMNGLVERPGSTFRRVRHPPLFLEKDVKQFSFLFGVSGEVFSCPKHRNFRNLSGDFFPILSCYNIPNRYTNGGDKISGTLW